jgi:hypothetical protein
MEHERLRSLVCLGLLLEQGDPQFAKQYADALEPISTVPDWPFASVPLSLLLAQPISEPLLHECERRIQALYASMPKI